MSDAATMDSTAWLGEALGDLYTRDTLTGMAYPLSCLRERLGPIRPSRLIIIGGKPGQGKTSYALAWYLQLLEHHRPAFLSLEMSKEYLWEKCAAAKTGIPGWKFERGIFDDADKEKIAVFVDWWASRKPLFADDLGFNAHLVEAFLTKEKPDIVFLDHIQMAELDQYKSEREGIRDQLYEWRRLTQKYKIPIVLVSQVNEKESAKRNDPRPRNEDLFGSSVLNRIADLILLVWWPAKETPYDEQLPADATKYFVGITKNRYGETRGVKMNFYADVNRFEEVHG